MKANLLLMAPITTSVKINRLPFEKKGEKEDVIHQFSEYGLELEARPVKRPRFGTGGG